MGIQLGLHRVCLRASARGYDCRPRRSGAEVQLRKNGTFVGERRIDTTTPLADGDEVRLGKARLIFRASADESTASASGGVER